MDHGWKMTYSYASLFMLDYRIPVWAQQLVIILLARRPSHWLYLLKPVFRQAGDSRLQQLFRPRTHLVEQSSLSPISLSNIIFLATGSLKPSLTPPLAGLLPVRLYFDYLWINLFHKAGHNFVSNGKIIRKVATVRNSCNVYRMR